MEALPQNPDPRPLPPPPLDRAAEVGLTPEGIQALRLAHVHRVSAYERALAEWLARQAAPETAAPAAQPPAPHQPPPAPVLHHLAQHRDPHTQALVQEILARVAAEPVPNTLAERLLHTLWAAYTHVTELHALFNPEALCPASARLLRNISSSARTLYYSLHEVPHLVPLTPQRATDGAVFQTPDPAWTLHCAGYPPFAAADRIRAVSERVRVLRLTATYTAQLVRNPDLAQHYLLAARHLTRTEFLLNRWLRLTGHDFDLTGEEPEAASQQVGTAGKEPFAANGSADASVQGKPEEEALCNDVPPLNPTLANGGISRPGKRTTPSLPKGSEPGVTRTQRHTEARQLYNDLLFRLHAPHPTEPQVQPRPANELSPIFSQPNVL